MTSKSETTPLVGSTGENPSYYFLQRTESMMKSTDNMEAEGEVVEMQPNGATGGEFDSRPVKTGGRARTPKKKATFWGATLKPPSGRIGQSGGAARGGSPSKRISGAILRQRQGAIKVEPKVFFANERTFLAWLHCSVLLAGASIAVMAFAEADVLSQLYGVILLPVAIAFLAYSMLQYARRSSLIRRRAPGPYEDIVGPTALGITLMISICSQFAVKLYSMALRGKL